MPEANDNDDSENKTEEPTAQRYEDFRKEGQVAQSRELNAFIVLISCVLVIYLGSPSFLVNFLEVCRNLFKTSATIAFTDVEIKRVLMTVFKSILFTVLPVAIVGFLAGILGSILQIGFNLSWKPLEPNIEKINPIKGLKKIFSMTSVVEGIKSILKIGGISYIAYLIISNSILTSFSMTDLDTNTFITYIGSTGFKMIGAISIALFVISMGDLLYKKYEYRQKLMMTRKEIKDELKEREGDSLLRARVRSVQREMAQKRMMDNIPDSDVIVTNPTHIAVAIKYDNENMAAPRVVAKGADHLAEKIKSIAKKSNIPRVENVLLARTLHKHVEVGQYIPRNLYEAVAKVLAYVYGLKGKVIGR